MRIGFVTCGTHPSITDDDGLAATVLGERGHAVEAVPWDGRDRDWGTYDLIVVRSPWNYHLEPDAFARWIDRIEGLGVPTANPPSLLRWNARKVYLERLEAAGVPVVPTRRAGDRHPVDAEEWARVFATTEVVVKPVVGASAYGVTRMRLDRDHERLAALARTSEMLVQPYLPEVAGRGEWSAIFLGGEYSHAVLKRPASGDFRVQEELGGRSEARPAPASIRSLGAAALGAAPGETIYARVDAVETASGPLLMELELIEPALYLGATPGAAARFADEVSRFAARSTG